jgi:hypothetical protein
MLVGLFHANAAVYQSPPLEYVGQYLALPSRQRESQVLEPIQAESKDPYIEERAVCLHMVGYIGGICCDPSPCIAP